ncbi:ribosome silencing factor [Priestia megaterium]|nr:ribosome silencing factor [Priestia megaterium]
MNQRDMLSLIVKAADDKKALDLVALDMQGISLVADYFVICHGNSDKQVQAIAREVKEKANEHDIQVKRMEGFEEARWVLVDLGNIVVHIFHKDDRGYYNLERLWGDAPSVNVQEELQS